MIGIHGQGSGAPVEIRKTISFDVPREIVECFNELQGILYDKNSRRPERDHSNVNIPTSLYQHVLRELASIEEEAVTELVSESHLTMNDVLAVGIHDTGIRSVTPEGLFYQGLCDASYLAEQTGLNIIDSFPIQDIAARGNGGPLFPLPAWIFLKSESRNRILIDLGRTAKLTFLPKADNAFSHQKIQQRDVIPCGSLLDSLTWQLTGGKTAVDIGGRLAVQGCQIPDLLTNLRAAMAPRCDWMPLGLTPDRYLQIAARSAGEGHSHQDILCTAACFIAETVAEQVSAMITETITESKLEPELLVCGAGRLHGLLMNSISSQLRQRPLASILHYGIPADTFDALCTAMMVLLAVDHIPGNLPHLTGSETVKTLGRMTPGSITNWHRLLREMAGTKPADRTLRSAM
jgi:anhydro-N-acetylmuramic acid kinase